MGLFAYTLFKTLINGGTKMRYAVIALDSNVDRGYRFSKWYEDKQMAVDEALRLAEKENADFAVIAQIGEAKLPKLKAQYKEFFEIKND